MLTVFMAFCIELSLIGLVYMIRRLLATPPFTSTLYRGSCSDGSCDPSSMLKRASPAGYRLPLLALKSLRNKDLSFYCRSEAIIYLPNQRDSVMMGSSGVPCGGP